MASNNFGGTATFKVDGQQYRLRGNFKVSPQSVENTGVAGADGVHGYTQKYVVPSIEGEISDMGGFSVTAMAALDGVTITLELGNGKTYVLPNAWYAGMAVLDGVQGQIPVKFECAVPQELTA